MKKLLILGAGEMQLPIIEKAKSLGVYTIVADMNASAVGMQYADRALVVSTMDLDMLKQYAYETLKKRKTDDVQIECKKIGERPCMGVVDTEKNYADSTKVQRSDRKSYRKTTCIWAGVHGL